MSLIRNFFIITVFLPISHVRATTKGLSQIVTPDLQKPADFSLSFQHQDSVIANANEFQAELGINPWSEIAIFEGLNPAETIFAAEFGIIQQEPWLLSAGVLNISTRGGTIQPFIESGYYMDHLKGMVGILYAISTDSVSKSEPDLLLGLAYDFDPRWRAQIDFQSGDKNFSTIGFTYSLNDRLQFNPALYFSNASVSQVSGYAVVTYTFPVWHRSEPETQGKSKVL